MTNSTHSNQLDTKVTEYLNPYIYSAVTEDDNIDSESLAYLLSGEIEELGLIDSCTADTIECISHYIEEYKQELKLNSTAVR